MADYYPLIARAVAGLDPNASGESRRALYERARTALIAQLRGVQPPLTEAEITRERLALEEAVRKVEAEAAHRMRGEPNRSEPPRGRHDIPPREGPRRGDILRDSARAARAAQSATPAARPPLSRGDAPPPYGDRPRVPGQPTAPESFPAHPHPPAGQQPHPSAGPGRPPQPGVGTRGFRDVVADTDELGRAASQANRSARKTFAKVASPSPEFERTEPDMEQRGAYAGYPDDESYEELTGHEPPPPKAGRGRYDGRAAKVRGGFPLKTVLIAGLALILIGGGILGYQKFGSSMFKSSPRSTQNATGPETGARPKITDRVGQADSGQQVAQVAQRAILYEEDPSDPQGKQTVGTVVWRLDQVAASPKQKPDTAIKAEVELPDRQMKVVVTIMRNTDPSMPATSHTMEIVFTVGPDFGTTIANVPGVYAKSPDQPRGTPLAATSVKVQDGYFLIGLSNVDVDRARNIQVLKERSSLDIPIVYGNGKRAILSIEKGPPGERAFNEAFSAWGQ
ncbi:putative protein OS=Afipia felis OX=1035 GN=NCTC12722_03395 PE=4 SV=1 [Afipia felis]